MGQSKGSSFWEGLILGGALAFTATILLVQKSGEEARADFSKKLDSLKGQGGDVFEGLKENSREVLETGVEVMDQALARLADALKEGTEAAAEKRKEFDRNGHHS